MILRYTKCSFLVQNTVTDGFILFMFKLIFLCLQYVQPHVSLSSHEMDFGQCSDLLSVDPKVSGQ